MCSEYMETLNNTDIETVANFLKGKKCDEFLASIEVLRESIAQGAWVKRGRDRVGKGFKTLSTSKKCKELSYGYNHPRYQMAFAIFMSLHYGSPLKPEYAEMVTDEELAEMVPVADPTVSRAWCNLCAARQVIYAELDMARPLPVYTEIGLSPKVTKTLQDADLDLDLSTRRACPVAYRVEDQIDMDGNVVLDRKTGEPVQVRVYYADWPENTVFGTSRFSHCDCEACGKAIPSRLVVPVIIDSKAGEPQGFFFGRDCAKNIFGIKDVGIEKK